MGTNLQKIVEGQSDRKGIRYVLVFLFSVVIYLFSIHQIGGPIQSGLDESYVIAINKYFANIEYARIPIFFSYGPLGFLVVPLPIGSNIIISTLFWNSFLFFFILSSLSIILLRINKINFVTASIQFFLCVWIVNASEIRFLPFLLLSNLLILDKFVLKEEKYFLILPALFIGIIGFFMGSYFVALFGYFFPLFVSNIWKKQWKKIIIFALFLILNLFLFRFLIYRDFNIFINLISILEFSIGNAYSMTIGADTFSWWLLLLCVIPFFLFLLFRKSEISYYFLISFVPLFLIFKYAFTRIDHISHFFNFLAAVLVNMMILALIKAPEEKN
ncbi:hypothetical protein JWG45_11745 [Leptospira sp. 201903070]|uniref:DUF2029 domain-containing protein n=1 Tax=Leptospira ainlahdjerensis TaxID=2810033 RepID=A0ABS2UBU0_9LEPT|nr:hypothetical protein [Leptospira ainlahdjerensis]MBM9577821.1 hypothetical protein [Leptospira ainlahdjerensis]